MKMNEPEILWHLGNMTFHAKTLVMTWMVMVAMFVFCWLGVRKMTSGTPGKMQNVLEWTIDFVRSLINDNMEDPAKGRPLLTYLLTLIVFILFSNMIGLFPNLTFGLVGALGIHFAKLNEIFAGPSWSSPTADINTTLALALLTIIIVVAYGIKHKKAHYFHHFVEPFVFFLPIHLLDLLAKPMTLAFRLFGNIFAGEVLIKVILMIPGIWVFGGIVPNIVWLAFCVFVNVIQSFVFTVLTTAYVGQATAE